MSDPQEHEDVERFDPVDPELSPEQIAEAERALESNEQEQGEI